MPSACYHLPAIFHNQLFSKKRFSQFKLRSPQLIVHFYKGKEQVSSLRTPVLCEKKSQARGKTFIDTRKTKGTKKGTIPVVQIHHSDVRETSFFKFHVSLVSWPSFDTIQTSNSRQIDIIITYSFDRFLTLLRRHLDVK